MVQRSRRGRLAPAVLMAFCGLCCGVLLLRLSHRARPGSLLSEEAAAESRTLARDITGELFGAGHRAATSAQRQRARLAATRQDTISDAVRLAQLGQGYARLREVRTGFPLTSGMMLDDEDEEGGEEGGDMQDDEYARFVWKKGRLEDEGVNVDTWLDPGLLGRIGYSDRPYTAGHHPADENITNTTTQFFADD